MISTPPRARPFTGTPRWFAGAAVAMIVFGAPRARAEDTGMAFDETELVPGHSGANLYYGSGIASGDFDGDGYGDLAVGEPGMKTVYLFSGSPVGWNVAAPMVLTPQRSDYPSGSGFYGGGLVALDHDQDGYDDLAAAASDAAVVFLYSGGPHGITPGSERLLVPGEVSLYGSHYGSQQRAGGDTDGDGFPELLVGDPSWVGLDDGVAYDFGAIFVYPGTSEGLDACAERRLVLPDRPASGYTGLGGLFDGDGDLNGDGYADLVAYCGTCDRDEQGPRADTFTWLGGPAGFVDPEAESIPIAGSLALVPDTDGDGFDDVVIGRTDTGTRVFFGSPSGLDATVYQQLSDTTFIAAGLADVDGDGFGDLLTGTWTAEGASVGLIFGSADRLDYPARRVFDQPSGPEDGVEVLPFALGDLNGDGHREFAASADLAGMYEGEVTVFSPACIWYGDGDGDGHGHPSGAVSDCHEQVGRVLSPDDCDDADPAVHGQLWYADADGDGFGVGDGVLACTQPANTSATRFDCDDADALRNPDAADADANDLDEDCDGHDGAWTWDTGDCPDTAGDTATPADTGDSADSGDSDGQGTHPTELTEPGCGCDSGRAPVEHAAVLLAGATAIARWRRRAMAGDEPAADGRTRGSAPTGCV